MLLVEMATILIDPGQVLKFPSWQVWTHQKSFNLEHVCRSKGPSPNSTEAKMMSTDSVHLSPVFLASPEF
jgi:hypothetical protein